MARKISAVLAQPSFPRIRALLLTLCLIALTGLIAMAHHGRTLRQFEPWTDDLRTAFLSDRLPGVHPAIAVVTIDENTLRHFNITTRSPLDREMLAKIIRRIKAAGASALGLDVFFLRPTDTAKDDALIEAIKEGDTPFVLGAADERVPMETWQRDHQGAYLKRAEKAPGALKVGYLNLRQERTDKTVRFHAMPAETGAYPSAFSLQLARTLKPAVGSAEGRRIAWLGQPRDGSSEVYSSVAAEQLFALGGAAPAGAELDKLLAGKIVLIGARFEREDRHRTPFNARVDQEMSGVFVHAHMIADLLEPGRAISEASTPAARVMLFVLALAGLLAGFLLSRSFFIEMMGWSFAAGLLVAVNAVAFLYWRSTFPFVFSALAWVLGVTAGRSLYAVVDWFRGRKAA